MLPSVLSILDNFQLTAIVICVAELVFISVYFNDYGKPTGMYVSDILFEVLPYKVVMTIFVGLQTVFSILFACRLYSKMILFFYSMIISVIFCLSGWIALNVEYLTDEGKTSDTHKFGTIFFMLGCITYSSLLVYTIRFKIFAILQFKIESILSTLVLILLLACIALGSVFMAALISDGSNAWVFEHTSFMTLVLAHTFFFTIETPNPMKPLDINTSQNKYIPVHAEEEDGAQTPSKQLDPASISLLYPKARIPQQPQP